MNNGVESSLNPPDLINEIVLELSNLNKKVENCLKLVQGQSYKVSGLSKLLEQMK